MRPTFQMKKLCPEFGFHLPEIRDWVKPDRFLPLLGQKIPRSTFLNYIKKLHYREMFGQEAPPDYQVYFWSAVERALIDLNQSLLKQPLLFSNEWQKKKTFTIITSEVIFRLIRVWPFSKPSRSDLSLLWKFIGRPKDSLHINKVKWSYKENAEESCISTTFYFLATEALLKLSLN